MNDDVWTYGHYGDGWWIGVDHINTRLLIEMAAREDVERIVALHNAALSHTGTTDAERLQWLLRRLEEADLFRIVGRAADADGVFTSERIVEVIDEDMTTAMPASLTSAGPSTPAPQDEIPYRATLKFDHETRVVTGTMAVPSSTAPLTDRKGTPWDWATDKNMADCCGQARFRLASRADANRNFAIGWPFAEELIALLGECDRRFTALSARAPSRTEWFCQKERMALSSRCAMCDCVEGNLTTALEKP